MQKLDDVSVLEDLDAEECLRLVATQSIGRVAFVVDGEAALLPVSFTLVGDMVIFRTALGSAFDSLVRDAEVVFEVDQADPAYHSGWSVVGRGRAQGLERLMPTAELERLALRPWARVTPPGWIGVRLADLTGRRIVQVTGLCGTTPG